jgi:hypothetical protein
MFVILLVSVTTPDELDALTSAEFALTLAAKFVAVTRLVPPITTLNGADPDVTKV